MKHNYITVFIFCYHFYKHLCVFTKHRLAKHKLTHFQCRKEYCFMFIYCVFPLMIIMKISRSNYSFNTRFTGILQ